MALRLPTFLRAPEIDRFLAAVDHPRDRVLCQLMLFCGLRNVCERTRRGFVQVTTAPLGPHSCAAP